MIPEIKFFAFSDKETSIILAALDMYCYYLDESEQTTEYVKANDVYIRIERGF